MKSNDKVKYRAKLEILSYLMSYCLRQDYDKGGLAPYQMERAFINDLADRPPVGSLVVLKSAPNTKWYLGWYIEYIPADKEHNERHLIESVEDGSLCNWFNVGFSYLPMETSKIYTEWRWTDKQFEFNDRWRKAISKCDCRYIVKGLQPEFKEDGSVELSLRRYSFGIEENPPEYFKTYSKTEWKQATLKSMTDFIKTAIKETQKKKTKCLN